MRRCARLAFRKPGGPAAGVLPGWRARRLAAATLPAAPSQDLQADGLPPLRAGAKATAEGVELYVQWADGTSGRVPTST